MARMWKERGQERLYLWCLVGRLTKVQNTERRSRKCTLGVRSGDCCNLYGLELLGAIRFTNGKGSGSRDFLTRRQLARKPGGLKTEALGQALCRKRENVNTVNRISVPAQVTLDIYPRLPKHQAH